MAKRIFLYPIDKDSIGEQNNNYIRQLIAYLGKQFKIVNGVTETGLLDALRKFGKTDVYYFNWIENLPAKRFGFLQVALLALLLILSKLSNKKVVWFVHNNIAHDKKHYRTKKLVARLMSVFADLILSHSNEITLNIPRNKLHVFHHPVENFRPLQPTGAFAYDMLIWGAVLPYKGVAEFVEFVATGRELRHQRILIAGKFKSDEYYERVMKNKPDNVTVRNEFIAEEELVRLFAQSRYILFTYASPSVLSSAALCKSLSFGKEIVAPNVGSFKELGNDGLVHTYSSFPELEALLTAFKENRKKSIAPASLQNYAQSTGWDDFSAFVSRQINLLYTGPSQNVREALS